MSEERLQALLKELHDELETDSPLDAETRALLRDARVEIEEALVDETKKATELPDVRSRLTQAIEHLEDRYPDGVVLLNRVLEALSHVGL